MSRIELKNVYVDFPILNARDRSFKNHLIAAMTGGRLGTDANGVVNIRALDNICLTLKAGERLGLIGHNGSGKSTLLRVLGKIYLPTAGSATIEGKIGSLIAISLGTNKEATGRENIYIRGSLLGLNKKTIQQHIDEIIEFCELGSFIDLPMHTYSSGMHIRLAFAIATIIRPEILLMDEWLSIGDVAFQKKAEARLVQQANSADILILASHSQRLIQRTCNRVVWLEKGQIKLDGPPETVLPCFFDK